MTPPSADPTATNPGGDLRPVNSREVSPRDGIPILQVSELRVEIPTPGGVICAAHDISLTVAPGHTLGLVGESGCGKSVSLRALISLLRPPARVRGGVALLDGRDLLSMSEREVRAVRGYELGMIFQDPMTALNPVLTIGDQLIEVLRVRGGLSRSAATTEAMRLLDRVGIPNAARRSRDYAHQFSGGMRQRVMIALAISCRPKLLLADEPTTGLDVTVQQEILALLTDLQNEYGMGMIIVSHDMGVIAQTCDAVAVMYAGFIVEQGPVSEVLNAPWHPYTAGLLASVPTLEVRARGQALPVIGGQPPDLTELPSGCPFIPRCHHSAEVCRTAPMKLIGEAGARSSACVRHEVINV